MDNTTICTFIKIAIPINFFKIFSWICWRNMMDMIWEARLFAFLYIRHIHCCIGWMYFKYSTFVVLFQSRLLSYFFVLRCKVGISWNQSVKCDRRHCWCEYVPVCDRLGLHGNHSTCNPEQSRCYKNQSCYMIWAEYAFLLPEIVSQLLIVVMSNRNGERFHYFIKVS